ncbi:tail fiber protein [Cedecea neteri]|uniref:Tail fiber protein n=1 Tax=Cedecea neteri TaxID=158822 RepID=A0A089Q519_9ENTR|nr:tail fiber protein [Cedecea neteri]AIR06346.1 tail fiber protein [Cedecea neteri]
MATNQFKPFATRPDANVTPQNEWENLPALLSGFAGGKASSAQVNKALRQTSFIAAALAQFVSDKSGQDVLDDGDIAAFLAKLTTGFGKQYLSRQNPFADIKADGAGAVSSALANLGLGEGSALPVGVPVPWPLSIPPVGWLKCNGAAFSAVQYPKLALVYPALVLPDLRGEFIRGWDDGRGVDPGRTLITSQAATKLPSVYTYAENETQGVLVTPPINTYQGEFPTEIRASDYEETTTGSGSYFSTSKLFPNGNSGLSTFRVRPRNLSFNYIVRTA